MRSTPRTVPELVRARASEQPDRRAFVAVEDAVTYGELDRASVEVAARLVAAGVGPGGRVGLLAENGIDWVVHAVAVARIGAVLVPLSTLLRPPELVAQLRAASVSHLLAAAEVRGRRPLDELQIEIADAPTTLPALRTTWKLGALPDERADDDTVLALGEAVAPADDMVVLFTSGSRGAPKGVIHTHGGALRATAAGLDARCLGDDDVLYVPMPFFWTGGFSVGLVSTLVAGATLLIEPRPEPARTLAFLERERATLFRGWPDQAAQLAAHPDFATTDLSSLRDASLAAVLPADRRPAPGARPIIFGMTESFGPYASDRLDTDLPPEKRGSCGRPFPGIEVSVRDPDTEAEVAADADGELWIRGTNILRGICGRERHEVFTADGWYRTGDLGRIDGDGYLWYSGRLDDMVKVKGATVYPSEVEAAIRSLDAVSQAHVTDVAGDGGRREIAALVVTDASLDDVEPEVRDRLSSFKVPTRWLVTDDATEVPRLASGKVDKPALQHLLTHASGGARPSAVR